MTHSKVPNGGPTNVRRHRTKFIYSGDVMPPVCAHLMLDMNQCSLLNIIVVSLEAADSSWRTNEQVRCKKGK